jgi:hypothetical protein
MKKILEAIDNRLNPELFAKSYNKPHIAGWIKRNYESGHWSKDDYIKIIKWVEDKNPNLENFDFKSALQLANGHIDSIKRTDFNQDPKINFKNQLIKFENGKEWHEIKAPDCNGIINKLMYDCSDELKLVHDEKTQAWALIDDQENVLCIAINNDNFLKIIGRLGNDPENCHDEIHSLCVRKGFHLSPHSFSHEELVDAIKSKVLNVDSVNDIEGLIKKLKPQEVIDCGLLKYCHYCNLSNMFYVYLKCEQDCILKYIMASLLSHGLTKGALYHTVKNVINKRPDLMKEFTINSADSRPYVELMNRYQKEIIEL